MKRKTTAVIVASLLGLAGCASHIARPELARRIEQGSPPPIVDVRTAGEYAESHVRGAVHIPFYSVLWHKPDWPEPETEGEPLVVYCEHGPRAGLARVGLFMGGAGKVLFLDGHMTAWKADGLPVESGSRKDPVDESGEGSVDDEDSVGE